MLKLIKKPLLFSLLVCCILGLLGGCNRLTAPAPTATPQTSSPTASISPTPSPTAPVKATPVIYVPTDLFYKNEDLGFTLDFPAEWKDRYIIYESQGSMSVYSKKVRETYKDWGLLFRIERFTGELITEEAVNTAVYGKILLRGNGYSYVMRTAQGGAFIIEDEKISAEYKDMQDKRADVCQTIKLWGTARPKASNAGYKVLGTDFFIAELPEKWDIKESTDALVCWDICSGGSKIGRFKSSPTKARQSRATIKPCASTY